MKENKIASREPDPEVCIPDETLKPREVSQPENMKKWEQIISMWGMGQ